MTRLQMINHINQWLDIFDEHIWVMIKILLCFGSLKGYPCDSPTPSFYSLVVPVSTKYTAVAAVHPLQTIGTPWKLRQVHHRLVDAQITRFKHQTDATSNLDNQHGDNKS